MDEEIEKKISELRETLIKELPDTVVLFELEITSGGISYRTEHRYPEDLKKDCISMRNIKGEFIK